MCVFVSGFYITELEISSSSISYIPLSTSSITILIEAAFPISFQIEWVLVV